MLRLDRIAVFIVDIRRRRSRVADLFIAVDALDLDFDWSRRVAIDRREMRVRGNDVVFRDCVRRDFRLAVYDLHVIVVQSLEGSCCCIREGQLVAIAYGCRPLAIRAVKCSFIVIADRAKILEQRFFRIAVDQVLTRLGAVRVVVLRRIERRTIDRLCFADIDRQISLINGQIALRFDDLVVNACITQESDIFHIDGICIRIFIEMSCRVTILAHSIAAAGFDGKVIGALVELIIIGKCLACCTFLRAGERCGEFPAVDGCVAVGLAAAAVDVDLASKNLDGAAVFCGCIGVAARCAFSCQVVAFRSSGFDVVNRIVLRFTGRCFIAARTRCGLCPAFARERAAASVVITYRTFRKGSFILSFIDFVSFVILSNERCFSGGRDISIRQFFAVDFRHIVGGDIDSRLYLEDVLVLIVSCQVRIARCAPLRICTAVEVRAELIGIWRVGIDFPVAAFARLDGILLCRRQILERTILALHVDDNSIVVLRIGLQRTVVILTIQFDNTILTRRGQVDVFMSRDTIDIDVARSLDIDALGVSRDAVADCDVLARDADAFVRVDNTRVVLTAANCDIASIDLDILQGNRVTYITSNVDFRISGIDDEARMLQILFLDKATNRTSSLQDIVPFRLSTEANRDDWARVVRLFFCLLSVLRIAIVPLDVVVVNGRTIVLGEFRAFAVVGHSFWASNPVISVRMLWISRRSSDATAAAADDQLILLWRAGQRVLKGRRDRSEIRIARVVRAFRRTLSHCLGTGPSN